jgi:hypothetical protein
MDTLHKEEDDDDDNDDDDNNNNNNKHHERKQQMQTMSSTDETIHYITSACPILAKEQHTKKHDGMYVQLHFYTCKEIGVILDHERRYDHVPKKEVVTVR